MNTHTCFETFYLQLLAADAAEIRRRANTRAIREFNEYRQQGLENDK